MDNYQGDLTDILRASGTSTGGALGQSDGPAAALSNWEFNCDPLGNLSSASALEDNSSSSRDNDNNNNDNNNVFGDPFINMRDPLLHELNNVVASGCSAYFCSTNSTDHLLSTTAGTSIDDACNFPGANSRSSHHHHKVFEEEINNNNNSNNSPCNIFSRIQISQNNSAAKLPVSPCDSPVIAAAVSPRGFKASPMMQISSPRNLGIKRSVCIYHIRKSQAKKVVCIPAPAAANSRPSGEVVPSDLWAWRKYGQKPIKGSPYPRGYYRCSSSKGCSARKQVERSRTDPNMLVITYTSEHNHPWPTQRNALAGSTRSQPPKNNAGSSKSSPTSHPQKTTLNTKEQKESSNDTFSPSNMVAAASASVKEEIEDIHEKHIMEMEDADQFSSDGFPQSSSYRPTMPDSSQSEDFFADLGEIEADPLDLLFSQGGFSGDHEQKGSKGLDPFGLFDWSEDTNNISFEEAKRDL
ncbi:WRKY transcription factor, putative [Ricinus communis]|uniref:WRKY transcription factor, putative n=1 Tax=Ricinus communis TaxID=3988 RepID=B9T696_RICCO|nr:WRKY transcription factor, putative [Ricinus communis]